MNTKLFATRFSRSCGRRLAYLAAASALTFGAAVQSPAIVIFYFDTITDPSLASPSGTSPWATLTITNSGVDEVTMSISHVADADPGQFIRTLLLNISGYTEPYSVSSLDAGFSFSIFGEDTRNPGGFDMQVSFSNSGTDRVTAGESVTWTVTGAGLTEDSFVELSATSEEYARLHFQALDCGDSQWVTANPVPEPTSIAALAIGAIGLLRMRRKA